MTDYCVSCGDAEPGIERGEYLGFEAVRDDVDVWVECFVCEDCKGGSR